MTAKEIDRIRILDGHERYRPLLEGVLDATGWARARAMVTLLQDGLRIEFYETDDTERCWNVDLLINDDGRPFQVLIFKGATLFSERQVPAYVVAAKHVIERAYLLMG